MTCRRLPPEQSDTLLSPGRLNRVSTMGQLMIFGQEIAQLTQPTGNDFKYGLVSVRQHLLLEMGDAQRAFEPYIALVGHHCAGDDPQQSGLAGAVPAHQADPLTVVNLEVDMSEQRDVVVGKGDFFKTKQRHAGWRDLQ